MRWALKLLLGVVAVATLSWLVPEITASFQRATTADATAAASRAYTLFSVYLLVGATLAVLLARDAAHGLGTLAGRLFFGGGRVPGITPVWWKSARLCRERRPREAIAVLRDYLDTHPRHWRVAVRIAEIYERELHDPLSAALEYEALLTRRLARPERAEIMLRLAACRLRRREGEAARHWLQAVLEEFPRTPAAETAARRLARLPRPGPHGEVVV